MFAAPPTIAAIATARAPGGIGVIRISGPRALEAARAVVPSLALAPVARVASFYAFSVDGVRLDEGLTLYFPAPHSFTGDDVVELHAHGAPTVLEALLRGIVSAGARLATAGEFTRRAVMNGKIDLLRAEAIADVVSAESEAAARAAAAQMAGGLSARIESIHNDINNLRADIEGALDFPDDVDEASFRVPERLAQCFEMLRALVEGARHGAVLRRGARVVLYGPVNAGKSTVFNRLIGTERALVDAEPGTTRDVLEGRIDLNGVWVTLVDSAGFRDAAGRLERRGIELSRQALASADLAVLLVPPGASADAVESWRAESGSTPRIEVASRADEGSVFHVELQISGVTGAGFDAFRRALITRLGLSSHEAVVVTSERHREVLERAMLALERAQGASRHSTLEVVGGELGLALAALAELTGADASTELLDAIFSRFCIGK